MIRLSTIVARLAPPATTLGLVQGAAELRAVTQAPPAHLLPAAWVVPVGDVAGAARVVNAPRQSLTATFGVVLAVADRSDPRGAAAADALTDVRRMVLSALLGWMPEGADGPCAFGGGEVLELETAALWWIDRYTVPLHLRP
ncbi:hypothetical protein HL658_10015 [Azospirillum sp. RWY-5-1]|uniref:DUF3168 domain-containing protein n=1 Tax=Azospirillum oleiclasticum TaxID=2735135 RepID=A0ABX2T9V5_9PROT|nr:hypothetical protein [Azospirillum oleiclasticum]NYZ12887.1 hypothetical protein [Azospirillum oleiclasticum]NYZ20047.1 hypothetical protein [Azospirillum oleiclasticum]